jgi:histone deacetylase 1/2
VFLTAVYLINRLPSRAIDSQTPVERLFGDKGDYSFLRIFGCSCWPNLRLYNKHKLEFWSIQCVFLGYSNAHKGYKCLDISTGHRYISYGIVFDKAVFPFANLHSNAGAQHRRPAHILIHRLTLPLNHNLSKLRLHRNASSCHVDSDFVKLLAT